MPKTKSHYGYAVTERRIRYGQPITQTVELWPTFSTEAEARLMQPKVMRGAYGASKAEVLKVEIVPVYPGGTRLPL